MHLKPDYLHSITVMMFGNKIRQYADNFNDGPTVVHLTGLEIKTRAPFRATRILKTLVDSLTQKKKWQRMLREIGINALNGI